MAAPYAEVIGDPIAQTKSPLIHRHWLAARDLEGDFRATRVTTDELPDFLARRREDPDWRGCNVTIPHKERVISLLDQLDAGARRIGAVNCIAPGPAGLTGRNTDIDGVACALAGAPLEGRKLAMIGAGGGARAALSYALKRQASLVSILVRDPERAERFRSEGPITRVEVLPFPECQAGLADAAAIVNASPLGMAGSPEMPPFLLDCVAAHASGATLLDMVYKQLETDFLAAGRAGGGIAVDGLTMLIGQARAAFQLFFGMPAPADEALLRDLLIT